MVRKKSEYHGFCFYRPASDILHNFLFSCMVILYLDLFSLWWIAACDSSRVKNWELWSKIFSLILCLNDSRKRNYGVSYRFNIIHYSNWHTLVRKVTRMVWKFVLQDRLVIFREGMHFTNAKGYFRFSQRWPSHGACINILGGLCSYFNALLCY